MRKSGKPAAAARKLGLRGRLRARGRLAGTGCVATAIVSAEKAGDAERHRHEHDEHHQRHLSATPDLTPAQLAPAKPFLLGERHGHPPPAGTGSLGTLAACVSAATLGRMRRSLALLALLVCLAVTGAAEAANGTWKTGRYDGRIAGDGVTTRRATSAQLEVGRTRIRAVKLSAVSRCDDGATRRESVALRAVRLKHRPGRASSLQGTRSERRAGPVLVHRRRRQGRHASRELLDGAHH